MDFAATILAVVRAVPTHRAAVGIVAELHLATDDHLALAGHRVRLVQLLRHPLHQLFEIVLAHFRPPVSLIANETEACSTSRRVASCSSTSNAPPSVHPAASRSLRSASARSSRTARRRCAGACSPLPRGTC